MVADRGSAASEIFRLVSSLSIVMCLLSPGVLDYKRPCYIAQAANDETAAAFAFDVLHVDGRDYQLYPALAALPEPVTCATRGK